MFNLDEYEEAEREQMKTSHGRFWNRIRKWETYAFRKVIIENADKEAGQRKDQSLKSVDVKLALAEHGFWWFVHNCISHPIIGILPVKKSFEFHDYTSKRINAPDIDLAEELKARRNKL
ncbi:MAG: hypothetical protein WC761_01045 [Candidatus Paceibacterota bacterium]|jgi:hypothetical protein